MKKEKIKLTKNIAYTLFTIGLVLLVIGVSYAAYTFTGTGTTENVITTGQIQIAFAEQNNIKLQNRYPETDAVGIASTDANSSMTFTVSGNISGDAVVNYAIGLTGITEGSTLTQDYIKIYLTKNGSVSSGFSEGSGKTIKSFETSKVTGYLDSHAIAQGSITGTQVDTYVLKAWIDENYDLPTTNTNSGTTHSATTTSETFSFKIKAIGTDNAIQIEIPKLDESGANVPELASNMIPVYYENGNWKKADSQNMDENHQWYDYNSKMWANAVTVTSTNRDTYLKASVGTPIAMDDINTMLVWIPRFSATGDTANYNGGTQANPGAFNITFVDKETSAHDAFTFGADSLSGFWIGKFENSTDTTCTPASSSAVGAGCNLTTIRPKILPNATSWRGASVSTFFYDIQNMIEEENQYGFDKTVDTTLDTHMLKNNEWGAVAYLTQSIYGRCSSSTNCTEVGINNNSSYITGYGAPAGTFSKDTNNGTYETSLGMDASTTGNIYGVYDMSGGAYEYVMGNYNNRIGSSQFTTLPNTKYYNVYTTGSAYTTAGLQHALTETSGWYGDFAYFVDYDNQWFHRGGINGSTSTGVFYFNNYTGNSSTGYGSRFSAVIN